MSDETEIENEDDVQAPADEAYGFSDDAGSSDSATAAARRAVREQLQSDIEAFLAAGGKISEIPPNVIADPPRKPQNNYGGHPI